MAATSLQDLFLEELRDAYDGEKRLVKALPKMAKAASSPDLQAAFTSHLRETERQVTRLEQVFRAIGETARGKKCEGIIGIVEEANEAIEELDGAVLDAALIAGAQKVEHYEIASYGTLAHFADVLGEDRAKQLLGETLDEEKAADEKLNRIAKSKINRQALMADDSDEAESFMVPSAMRRAATAIGIANDAGGSRTSGRSGRSSGRSSKSSSSSRGGQRRRPSTKRSR